MTRFLLIRHGMTDAVGHQLIGRRAGIGLNERGREQALALVTRLHDVVIDAIFVSPLARTRETAEPLAQARGLRIGALPGLNEIDYGRWQGATIESLAQDEHWHAYNAHRSLHRVPGGETAGEAQLRMLHTVEGLHGEYAGRCVALVGHGDPIKTLLLHLLGMPMDFIGRLEVAPASVSAVHFDPDGPQVICVNHTGRLQELWE